MAEVLLEETGVPVTAWDEPGPEEAALPADPVSSAWGTDSAAQANQEAVMGMVGGSLRERVS